MNRQDNSWDYDQDSQGGNSSWDDWAPRGYRNDSPWHQWVDGRGDDGRHQQTNIPRKEKRSEVAKSKKRIANLEALSRAKYVDRFYDESQSVHYFFPVSMCGHCKAPHFGCPCQGGSIENDEGKLTQVPCPVQDAFLYEYGEETMTAMIKEGIRCGMHIMTINGMKLACNGNHPSWVHEEVCSRLGLTDEDFWQQELFKRIWMAELPLVDHNGYYLCGKKQNDPPNEHCLLRATEKGQHLCGRRTCLTVTMLRDAQDHELNALPRELQIAYLYVADLNKRQAFFSRFFSRYDYEAIEAM